jgi:hypothetical protein
VLHILLNACPPEVHQSSQGWQLLTDLGPGGVAGRELMMGGQRFDGLHLSVQSACDLQRRGKRSPKILSVELSKSIFTTISHDLAPMKMSIITGHGFWLPHRSTKILHVPYQFFLPFKEPI